MLKKKTLTTPLKRYIVRKYILARSVSEALSKERRTKPDDAWVDEDWKKENPNQLSSAIGFTINDYDN